ncbi:hypothetical protein TrST_g7430 [Triparma strigata]|uniref:Vacuolar fusion protein MON1 n=1 Tax=Triparma strigata TaxID=1606541 RepID=A0A9W6ZHB8_9STRA|nr:hypothetical protein TrST_g7430 [Triparma strigata]
MSSLHYLILSSSGKPIFSTHPTLSMTSSAATSTLLSFSESLNLPLQSLITPQKSLYILKKSSLYLLCEYTSSSPSSSPPATSLITLTLEYLYLQILFTLTSKVHTIFKKSPSFDLRGMLGATEGVMNNLVYERKGAFVTQAVESVKMKKNVRDEVTHSLKQITVRIPLTLYGLLLSSSRLLSLLLPQNNDLCPLTSDLHLLINFIEEGKGGLMKSESWVPVCLPGFREEGFLYAYICCLHHPTSLFLVLISSENDPSQFFQFQNAKDALIKHLRLDDGINGDESLPPSPIITSLLSPPSNTSLLKSYAPGLLHFLYKRTGKISVKLESEFIFPVIEKECYECYSYLIRSIRVNSGLEGLREEGKGEGYIIKGAMMYVIVGEGGKEVMACLGKEVGVREGFRRVRRCRERVDDEEEEVFFREERF